MEIEIDISNLSLEDLQDEYVKLQRNYKQLRDISENDAQQIHDLKRNLATATAAEAFLASELEQLTNVSTNLQKNNECRIQNELEEMRRKHHQLNLEYNTLQQELVAANEKNIEMLKEIEHAKSDKRNDDPDAIKEALEATQKVAELERENLNMLEKLEKYHEEGIRYTITLAERDRNIAILKDQLDCLEENMKAKREELEELTQLLESTQEQLAEANAKIALMTTEPETKDRKGNSLFAEVDDQRQAMKQLLAAQKKSYMQMKKIYSESEYEIRRLKRENLAMQTELQTCSSIFCNADRTYHNKLNEQIRYLTNQNDELQEKLKWTQERLKEVANSKGVLCIDTIFNFCKLETDDLKKQMHSLRIQNANLEQQLRNVTQNMARWRFESLKTRCVLMDRENLLNHHKIAFKPNNAVEFNINEQELNTAQPKIANPTAALVDVVTHSVASAHLNDSITKEDESNKTNCKVKSNHSLLAENIATKVSNSNCSPKPVCSEIELESHSDDKENAKVPNESEISTPLKKIEETLSPKRVAGCHLSQRAFANELRSSPQTQELPSASILSKNHKFGKENEKNVKFSASEPIVHNLSPNHSLVDSTLEESKVKAIVTQYRSKSNVVVRRITIKSNEAKAT